MGGSIALDRVCYGVVATLTGLRLAAYKLAARIPMLAGAADRRLVAIIRKQLASWGRAQFTSHPPTGQPRVEPSP
jgi:hypothetical protein